MKKDATKSTVWGYSAFGFGSNCLGGILGSFLTLYLTDNLMLSAGFIAGMMLVGRIANALMELLMGIVIDHVKGKHGKARPWILGTAFFTALPVFMLFNTPAGLGDLGTKIWVMVCYLMHIAVFGAAISIAYSALLVKAAGNPNTRVKMTNLSNLMGQVAGLLASSYGIPILLYFGGYETGYRGMTLIFCLVGFIGMFLTGLICKELPEEMGASLQDQKEKLGSGKIDMPLKKQLGLIFRNKYALPVLFMFILYYFASMLINSITVYFARDIMGNAGYMTGLSYAKMIPIIVIALVGIVPFSSARFGKKTTLTAGAVLLAAGYGVMIFAPESYPVVLAGNILFGVGTAFYGAVMKATVADVTDYINITNRIDVTGTVSSVASMGMRAGMALGSVGLSVLLSLGGYSGEAAKAGLPQSSFMLLMEKVGYIYIPVICYILLIVISRLFNVDQEVIKIKEEGQEAEA